MTTRFYYPTRSDLVPTSPYLTKPHHTQPDPILPDPTQPNPTTPYPTNRDMTLISQNKNIPHYQFIFHKIHLNTPPLYTIIHHYTPLYTIIHHFILRRMHNNKLPLSALFPSFIPISCFSFINSKFVQQMSTRFLIFFNYAKRY